MAAAAVPTPSADWIPIGRACAILGVNPATLRQWTRDGKVHVYRTPGGHRRFSTSELADLQQATAGVVPSPLAETVVAELQSKYRGFSHSAATHHGWLAGIDDDDRQRFHGLGERLLGALETYLTAATPRARQQALARARQCGSEYGIVARGLGASPAAAVEAYLVFRRPLLDVLARIMATRRDPPEQVSRIMRDAERLMDAVLMALTEDRVPASAPGEGAA